ncbi:hypothetical protein HQ544_04315 [Candidatus Falkowbacteria bacterium]|nr:hypothetical protein [Candidatus Falkowbacteria bacterium]
MSVKTFYETWGADRVTLAVQLHKIGAVKFGWFRLKLHETEPDAPLSPFYFDLRLVRSDPKGSLRTITTLMESMLTDCRIICDCLADIPYGGSPIATALSIATGIPQITPRKEVKDYGVRATVLGNFRRHNRVLVVDDLVTRAHSKEEAIKTLEAAEFPGDPPTPADLTVRDVLVVVDREQGAQEQLAANGRRLHAIFKARELFRILLGCDLITRNEYDESLAYLDQEGK